MHFFLTESEYKYKIFICYDSTLWINQSKTKNIYKTTLEFLSDFQHKNFQKSIAIENYLLS